MPVCSVTPCGTACCTVLSCNACWCTNMSCRKVVPSHSLLRHDASRMEFSFLCTVVAAAAAAVVVVLLSVQQATVVLPGQSRLLLLPKLLRATVSRKQQAKQIGLTGDALDGAVRLHCSQQGGTRGPSVDRQHGWHCLHSAYPGWRRHVHHSPGAHVTCTHDSPCSADKLSNLCPATYIWHDCLCG